jgi:peptide/nickel transport system ATP-binding protein
MPHGCRFAPRCPFAEQRCIDAAPPDKVIAGVHRVACWLAPVEQVAAPVLREEMA